MLKEYDAPMGDETMEMKLFFDREDEDEETPWEKFLSNLSVVFVLGILATPIIAFLIFFIAGHVMYPALIPWFWSW